MVLLIFFIDGSIFIALGELNTKRKVLVFIKCAKCLYLNKVEMKYVYKAFYYQPFFRFFVLEIQSLNE